MLAVQRAFMNLTCPISFADTGLADVLRSLAVTSLTLVGFMTHMCVSSTARAALDLGIATTVVHDATATRALPAIDGGPAIRAEQLQQTTLAALADRFSIVASSADLLA